MLKNLIQKGKITPKPWGHELLWAETSHYVGKLLFIKKGESLSLQYHVTKEETLYLSSGKVLLEAGESVDRLETVTLHPADTFHVRPKFIHRMEALEDSVLFEVSTPQLQDVVRLKDRYGR